MSQHNVEGPAHIEITIEANDATPTIRDPGSTTTRSTTTHPRHHHRIKRLKETLKKYFWDGQVIKLPDGLPPVARDILTRRFSLRETFVSFVVPLCILNFVWWTQVVKNNYLELFVTRYHFSIATVFLSFIGGVTSEHCGLYTFPFMTLAMGTSVSEARDFGLLLQTCELFIACSSITWKRLEVDWASVTFGCVGGFFGMLFGFEILDRLIPQEMKHLLFVSLWIPFGFAIFFINRESTLQYFEPMIDVGTRLRIWLGLAGFANGNITALYGCGSNIFTHTFLSLLFRQRQNLAGPTTIVTMAFHSLFGFYWREFMTTDGMSSESWNYFTVSLPIAAFASPLGAFFSEHLHKHIIANLGMMAKIVALVATVVSRPLSTENALILANLICTGFVFYFILMFLGKRRLENKVNRADDSSESGLGVNTDNDDDISIADSIVHHVNELRYANG